jgi:hypothetical protein
MEKAKGGGGRWVRCPKQWLTTVAAENLALAFPHPSLEPSWGMQALHNVALCLLQPIGLKNGQGCGVWVRPNVAGKPKT